MNDRYDDLISAFEGVNVTPDPKAKKKALALVRKKTEKTFQENPSLGRPIFEPSEVKGEKQQTGRIKQMAKKLKRNILLGTSGLATATVAAFLVIPSFEFNNSAKGADETINSTQSNSEILQESHSFLPRNPISSMADAVMGKQGSTINAKSRRATEGFQSGTSFAAPTVMSSPARIMPHPGQIDADYVGPELANNDRFPTVEESQVKQVSVDPVSTFSIDVDTASYATLRSYLMGGRVPSEDAVRIEEMINYFHYGYEAPLDTATPFSVSASNFRTPWDEGTELVRIGLQGVMPETDERPPLDLVFLVDTSGSMRSADKLGLLKQSLKLMLPEMREGDRIGIVTYAGSAGVKLQMTDATDRAAIEQALDQLAAGGSTAGAAGLEAAYGLLEHDEDRIGRVILATDGDFNVGMSSVDEMKQFIEDKRDGGSYLSVLGFGRGNYNDALMQTLAQNGNGQAAYIDTLSEAQKVLVDQLSGTLFTIASDVKVQVEFNPLVVSEYRLIGYETRALNREDFKNDKVDAGDIGAGHQVTALYEITPVGSTSGLFETMRYEKTEPVASKSTDLEELGFLRLRYKNPGEAKSQLIEVPISTAREEMTSDDAFVSAIAGWGQDLKGGRYIGDWGMEDAVILAREGLKEDAYGYRAEALRLMKLYQSLSR